MKNPRKVEILENIAFTVLAVSMFILTVVSFTLGA